MSDFLRVAFASGSPFTLDLIRSLKKVEGKTLNQLNSTNYDVEPLNLPLKLDLIITQPDYEHRKKIHKNPLGVWGEEEGVQIFKPEKINKDDKTVEFLKDVDMVVTASYGQIIGQKILKIPTFGWINWHPSKLPKYRGPSPVQQTLLNGDKTTALTWIEMDKGMDSGLILLQEKIEVKNDNFTSLIQKAVKVGEKTIFKAIQNQILIKMGENVGQKQKENEATFTSFITKEMGVLDLKNETTDSFMNKFKAFNEFPKIKVNLPGFEGLTRIDEVGEILKDGENLKLNRQNYLSLKDGLIQLKKVTLSDGRQIKM